MRRGVIAVKGPVRDFAGLQMKGGTIVLLGGAEIRTGAWMVRGTIISLTTLRLMPTFTYACAYNPTFLRIYAKHLQAMGFSIPHEVQAGYRTTRYKHRGYVGPRQRGDPYLATAFVTIAGEMSMSTEEGKEIATLGGGCFWCLEAVFELLQGVARASNPATPAGPATCSELSGSLLREPAGHAEVVQITFDPAVLSFTSSCSTCFLPFMIRRHSIAREATLERSTVRSSSTIRRSKSDSAEEKIAAAQCLRRLGASR